MEYLKQTAIVNPHARFTFIDPEGRKHHLREGHDDLPPPTKEIKPHPDGLELGTLMNMAKETKDKTLVQVPAERLQPHQRPSGQGDMREGWPGPGEDQPASSGQEGQPRRSPAGGLQASDRRRSARSRSWPPRPTAFRPSAGT